VTSDGPPGPGGPPPGPLYVVLPTRTVTVHRAQVGRVVVGGIVEFRDGTCEWYARSPAAPGAGHAPTVSAARAALH
jgi:hypothetical protein